MKEGIIQIEKKGENVKEKVRSRNLSNNFGVIWRLMSRISKVFFNSVPFPFCSTPLAPPLYAILGIPIGSLYRLKGTRYSVAEFTPPSHNSIPHIPVSDPLAFPSPRPFFPFFPQLFMWKKRGEKRKGLLSSRFLCAFRTRAWRDSPRTWQTHTRG